MTKKTGGSRPCAVGEASVSATAREHESGCVGRALELRAEHLLAERGQDWWGNAPPAPDDHVFERVQVWPSVLPAAAEQGAHFVKTYYCENFEQVVNSTPVPIVMAGGKKIPELDALTMAHNAVQQGAAGVDMGRNIFQAEDPLAMIQAVRSVVHENNPPDKAYQMYQDLKASK